MRVTDTPYPALGNEQHQDTNAAAILCPKPPSLLGAHRASLRCPLCSSRLKLGPHPAFACRFPLVPSLIRSFRYLKWKLVEYTRDLKWFHGCTWRRLSSDLPHQPGWIFVPFSSLSSPRRSIHLASHPAFPRFQKVQPEPATWNFSFSSLPLKSIPTWEGIHVVTEVGLCGDQLCVSWSRARQDFPQV